MRSGFPILILVFIAATFSPSETSAQHDSICFYRDGKNNEEVKISLQAYPLKLKRNGEKTRRVKIFEYSDTTLSVHIQCSKKERNAIENKYGTAAYMTIRNGSYSRVQQDSISRRTDSLKTAAEYAQTELIKLDDIRYVKISNRHRNEMMKKVQTIDALGFASALAIIASPYTKSPVVYVAVASFGLGVGIASLVCENKIIRFYKGWKIKQVHD